MRRAVIAAFGLALVFNGLSWVYAGIERDRRKMALQWGVPPEAEILKVENESMVFGFSYRHTAEFRLPSRPVPEEWLRRIARRPGYRLERRSRYEYRFETGDLGRSVTYDPNRHVYRLNEHF